MVLLFKPPLFLVLSMVLTVLATLFRTVLTVLKRVAKTVNTHDRTKNYGGLNSSTIDNRVAQTVITCEKANNMVA